VAKQVLVKMRGDFPQLEVTLSPRSSIFEPSGGEDLAALSFGVNAQPSDVEDLC
jgi:hypothetical protein